MRYRITGPRNRVLTYLPDHEPALGALRFPSLPRAWTSGGTLAADADLLIHDSQYSDADLDRLMAQAIDSGKPAYEVTPGIEGATFNL